MIRLGWLKLLKTLLFLLVRSYRLHAEKEYLHVQAEEGVACGEAVAARSRHHVARQGLVALGVLSLQQGGGAVHHLIHITAHAIQGQVVCHLRTQTDT